MGYPLEPDIQLIQTLIIRPDIQIRLLDIWVVGVWFENENPVEP